MLVGSGLLANTFPSATSQCEDVCIYAAGVSNSSCIDSREFARESQRLSDALLQAKYADVFVYFGTCSVDDSEARATPYVQHKLAMEQIVRAHSRHLILRLPQVAGKTQNPHTLLNFLYAHISRGESFTLWSKAKRNIIDVVDVVNIAQQLMANTSMRNTTLNVANTDNYSMPEIVRIMECVVGKCAKYDLIERGTEYFIDTSAIRPLLDNAGTEFGDDYLEKTISSYYAS